MVTINKSALGITGKGAVARIEAVQSLCDRAYLAESNKVAFLDAAAKALGASPCKALVAFAREEIVIGLAAARMPLSEFPADKRGIDSAPRLAMTREWVVNYQAPSKAVSGKVPALCKGKVGWRSAVQDRIIRNAEKRASVYLAELNATDAQTDKARNEKSKARKGGGDPAPHHGKGGGNPAPHHGKGGKAAAPSHAELVKPAKPLNAVEFAGQLLNMLSTAMQYDNKHAAIRPIEYSAVADGLAALHKVALAADAAMHVRLAADQADKPAKRKAKAA